MITKRNFLVLMVFLTGQETIFSQAFEGASNPVMVNVGKAVTTKESEEKITLEALGITKVPRYHALIIGVSEYRYEGPRLSSLDMPVKDAEKLADLLAKKYYFDSMNIKLLRNPTREEIINALDHLSENISEKDNLLIFYAGHGYYDRSKDFGFWLPSDAKIDSRSAWIPNSHIKDYISAIKTRHTLLITDACFGGSIFKTRSVETATTKFYELYKNGSRKALTSGNLTEVPDKSVFLKFLIKNLEEFEGLFLPASVLYTRMYEPVMNNALTTPQYGVIQGSGDEGGDFIFIKRN